MQTFRNINFIKRDYEASNIVACVAESAPGDNWEPTSDDILKGLTKLYRQAGVDYYGYL